MLILQYPPSEGNELVLRGPQAAGIRPLTSDSGPEGAELEGLQTKREIKAASTSKYRRNNLSGAQASVTMEVMVAVHCGSLVHALRILQRRRFPTHRGGGHNEIP